MKLFLSLIVMYLVFCAVLFLLQKRFIYFPYSDLDATPDLAGMAYREVTFRSDGGPEIHGWVVEAADQENTRGHILFCHGNAGNISHRLDTLMIFSGLGFRTLLFDYRGYGRSGGSADEEGLYDDGEAAAHFLCDEYSLDPDEIVYFGRSLGGAVALELARRRPPAALVLESSFTRAAEMGGVLGYIFPLRLIVNQKYDNISKIPEVDVPILFIHSKEDEIVPFEQGRRLFDAAVCEKEFLEIEGGHNTGFLDSGEAYPQGLSSFLNRISDRKGP